MGIFPCLETSIFEFSSLPIGTSGCGKFGIAERILSNSFLIFDCNFTISSIFFEISLDFSNNFFSFNFEISFFSFSRTSFSWMYLRLSLSNKIIFCTSISINLFLIDSKKLLLSFLISLMLCIFVTSFFNNTYWKYR